MQHFISTFLFLCNPPPLPPSSSSPDFTSDSLALDISLSLSDTLAGLIGCQLWRRGRGDQRR